MAEAQVRAAASLEEELQRRAQRPEGMVLIEPREQVELGGGPLDRNEPRVVTLRPFYLAQREVTGAEYATFLASESFDDPGFWGRVARRLGQPITGEPARPKGWDDVAPPEGEEDLPVRGITWFEAWGYALFVGMRLPSDDEWEYAARYPARGAARRFPWGEEWREGTLAAAIAAPGVNDADRTDQGLYDMGGNVSEWVFRRGAGGELRSAARGGSYLYPFERIARGTHRLLPRPSYRGPQLGLRLAKDVVE